MHRLSNSQPLLLFKVVTLRCSHRQSLTLLPRADHESPQHGCIKESIQRLLGLSLPIPRVTTAILASISCFIILRVGVKISIPFEFLFFISCFFFFLSLLFLLPSYLFSFPLFFCFFFVFPIAVAARSYHSRALMNVYKCGVLYSR